MNASTEAVANAGLESGPAMGDAQNSNINKPNTVASNKAVLGNGVHQRLGKCVWPVVALIAPPPASGKTPAGTHAHH